MRRGCDGAWTIDCLYENLLSPVVQGLPLDLSKGSRPSMDLGWNAYYDSPRMWRLWCSSELFGHDEVTIDRFFKRSDQLVDTLAMKSDDICDACQTPEKNPILGIEFDSRGIFLVFERFRHGRIPTDSRNSRTART